VALDFVIIANPTAGSQGAPSLAGDVCKRLNDAGASAELKLTTAAGDARRLAAEAADAQAKCVVGSGGDGTLQEIAGSLEGTGSAFGILPGGRCNDFAHALGLHKSDSAQRLTEILLKGKRRAIDMGAMGSKRFLTVATLGFDSEVSRFVETRKMWLKGTPAYLYGVLRTLISFRAPRVRLSGDFGTHEGRVLLTATGNSYCYGGAMQIAPGAKLDDGLFQLCVVDDVSRLTVLRILPRVLNGTHVNHPAVKLFATRKVEIETPDERVWVCADGETLGQTPCTFEVLPGALQVIVP